MGQLGPGSNPSGAQLTFSSPAADPCCGCAPPREQ